MKKILVVLAAFLMLSGCSGAKEKAACALTSGNNTVSITEGRDISSDKDGQIIHLKQTIQVESTEEDVLLIYREHYEKELSEYAADEKMKTSITETETGFLVVLDFDVKNISSSSKDQMMKLLETDSLSAETLLNQMKEAGFKCSDEEESETPETDESKKEAE